MTTQETHEMALEALKCLQDAVREELQKKAMLGHYCIINRDGKRCRVPADEALKMIHRE